MEGGYPWLAHDCLNYLVSCKTCNQDNKKIYFPVSGPRGTDGDNVHQLNQSERPFLVNPVGTDDVRPEELVGFRSFVAVPCGTQGHERRRGQVIITLFGLNLRDELILRTVQPDQGDVAISRTQPYGKSDGTRRRRA